MWANWQDCSCECDQNIKSPPLHFLHDNPVSLLICNGQMVFRQTSLYHHIPLKDIFTLNLKPSDKQLFLDHPRQPWKLEGTNIWNATCTHFHWEQFQSRFDITFLFISYLFSPQMKMRHVVYPWIPWRSEGNALSSEKCSCKMWARELPLNNIKWIPK